MVQWIAALSMILQAVPVTKQGVHRRSLTRAVRAAWWLDLDQDAAAIRAAGDLADMIDQLRDWRMQQVNLTGLGVFDTKEAWHAASVHAKYLAALEQLRLTPATRPEQVADDTADLISSLRDSLKGDA